MLGLNVLVLVVLLFFEIGLGAYWCPGILFEVGLMFQNVINTKSNLSLILVMFSRVLLKLMAEEDMQSGLLNYFPPRFFYRQEDLSKQRLQSERVHIKIGFGGWVTQ